MSGLEGFSVFEGVEVAAEETPAVAVAEGVRLESGPAYTNMRYQLTRIEKCEGALRRLLGFRAGAAPAAPDEAAAFFACNEAAAAAADAAA